MLFQMCDKNKDGRLEADEFHCYEDPLPETLGAYHAYSLLQIEKALKQKASPGKAHAIDQKLSHDEVSQALGFGKANKVGSNQACLFFSSVRGSSRLCHNASPCSTACDSSASELPPGAVSGRSRGARPPRLVVARATSRRRSPSAAPNSFRSARIQQGASIWLAPQAQKNFGRSYTGVAVPCAHLDLLPVVAAENLIARGKERP